MILGSLPEVATLQTKFGHRSLLRSGVGKINSMSVGVALEATYLSRPDAVAGELRHEGDIDGVVLNFIQRNWSLTLQKEMNRNH